MSTADLAAVGERPAVPLQAEGSEEHLDASSTPLLSQQDTDDLRSRWTDIQAGFVDEPRGAVEQADALVAGAIRRLAESFAQERAGLEAQWDRGGDVSTEELRIALQRYRAFFSRLLAA